MKQAYSSTEIDSSLPLRTRFAPTPSGLLHVGNAYSFILAWLLARKHGGRIVLRVDDLDNDRMRAEFVADIFNSLDWLGLDFDEGPSGPDELSRTFSQSFRLDRYVTLLDEIRAMGLAFACRCSRGSIQRESVDGLHPQTCRERGDSFEALGVAWRISTPTHGISWRDCDGPQRTVDLHTSMREFVIRRKEGIPSYQVASLVDDLDLRINLVVRGEDLLASTAAQRWLAGQLGKPMFLRAAMIHHPLITDANGEKLSKSAGSESLRSMREVHPRPHQLYRRLSPWLGLPEPVENSSAALAAFQQV